MKKALTIISTIFTAFALIGCENTDNSNTLRQSNIDNLYQYLCDNDYDCETIPELANSGGWISSHHSFSRATGRFSVTDETKNFTLKYDYYLGEDTLTGYVCDNDLITCNADTSLYIFSFSGFREGASYVSLSETSNIDDERELFIELRVVETLSDFKETVEQYGFSFYIDFEQD